MTFTVTALLGLGVLFIASALDDSTLIESAKKILQGNQINWSGQQPAAPSTTSV